MDIMSFEEELSQVQKFTGFLKSSFSLAGLDSRMDGCKEGYEHTLRKVHMGR